MGKITSAAGSPATELQGDRMLVTIQRLPRDMDAIAVKSERTPLNTNKEADPALQKSESFRLYCTNRLDLRIGIRMPVGKCRADARPRLSQKLRYKICTL